MRGGNRPQKIAAALGRLYTAALHKFYLDEFWLFITQSIIFRHISTPVARFDKRVVDGSINGLGWVVARSAAAIKFVQSGKVQLYVVVFVLGTLAIAVWALLWY
jgi:NADH-quinone oxidoreductase subunit L